MKSELVHTIRALPTLLRVGVSEVVAYRAEFVVWMLVSSQPLVMMSLWTSVTRHGGPFKSFDSEGFASYYLAVMLIRLLIGNWVAWRISSEIRSGEMSFRLLRPIHPFISYTAEHLAAIPMRSAIALPLLAVLAITSTSARFSFSVLQLSLVVLSVIAAWTILFAIQCIIGSLGFFITNTLAISNLYIGLFSLFSGYLMPLELLPAPMVALANWLPFRFVLSVPVQILTTTVRPEELANLLGGQVAWAVGLMFMAWAFWKAGLRRYESVGS